MAKTPILKPLEFIYEHFKKDTSKMLVITGTLGWALSSLAQMGAVITNSKLTPEQKSFLLPQELMDAIVNVGAFFTVTLCAKKLIAKMASTGKIAPTKVREYLNKHKDLYGNKIGKFDFDLDTVLKNDKKFPADSYYSYKNFVTTVGTVGAGILSSNIITPVIRNATASRVQKNYIENKDEIHARQRAIYQNLQSKGNMRI